MWLPNGPHAFGNSDTITGEWVGGCWTREQYRKSLVHWFHTAEHLRGKHGAAASRSQFQKGLRLLRGLPLIFIGILGSEPTPAFSLKAGLVDKTTAISLLSKAS